MNLQRLLDGETPALHAILWVVELHLEGSQSLKDKRQRCKGFFERWGKHTQVAVTETAYRDTWNRSQWSFILTGASAPQAQQLLARLEQDLLESVDAVVSVVHQERLF